ncbi:MAG: ACP S-malonyltransferase [Alphaproteobacteria bacterium]
MTRAFVFPGQGSQTVGMGRDLADAFPVARHVFEEVDDALRQNLTRLIFNGPSEELTLTENAQPALMAVSMAVMRVLEKEGGLDIASSAVFVAGHSLGEYSALAATRAFSLADAAWLLKSRGWAMQRAVPVGIGGMAALIGLDLDVARDVAQQAAEGDVCTAANDNAPQQVVVSGHIAAVERALVLAAECGARRSTMLPVSAPFHCSLMKPAADAMVEALGRVTVNRPVLPLVANVTASRVEEPDEIRRLLVEQITGAVRWRESVLYLRDQGVTGLVEIGAGKILTGLVKRISRDLTCVAINTPQDIEAFLKAN